jgi:hypothetical protein
MGIKHRESDVAFDSILSPESINSFMETNTQSGGYAHLRTARTVRV